jgi:hypothetical protein
MNLTSLIVSFLALAISGLTAWLTVLRPGTIRMTQPTTIYFGPAGATPQQLPLHTKIYLRSLLS